MKRHHWTDEEIARELLGCAQRLGRMPSARELRLEDKNALACIVARTGGGYLGWATRLGLAVKDSETARGQSVEALEADRLRSLGFKVERQTCKAPFDLLVDGVRVDVKSGAQTAGSGYAFALNKIPPTCDLYLIVGVDGDRILWRYYIPAASCHLRMLIIRPTRDLWSRFKEDIGQLRALIAQRTPFALEIQ